MEALAVSPLVDSPEHPRVRLLLAGDDAGSRSLLATRVLESVGAVVVLEAEDGAEAVQLGLQHRPQIALLDVEMPKLGGIDVAITLRELAPTMRLAVRGPDPRTHHERARAHRLPLFGVLEQERTLRWLEGQVQACADGRRRPTLRQSCALECSSCGYGIACARPPARCPMCHAEDAWIEAPWRPFRREVESVP
jgi:CheY-like chemotaxis protein